MEVAVPDLSCDPGQTAPVSTLGPGVQPGWPPVTSLEPSGRRVAGSTAEAHTRGTSRGEPSPGGPWLLTPTLFCSRGPSPDAPSCPLSPCSPQPPAAWGPCGHSSGCRTPSCRETHCCSGILWTGRIPRLSGGLARPPWALVSPGVDVENRQRPGSAQVLLSDLPEHPAPHLLCWPEKAAPSGEARCSVLHGPVYASSPKGASSPTPCSECWGPGHDVLDGPACEGSSQRHR